LIVPHLILKASGVAFCRASERNLPSAKGALSYQPGATPKVIERKEPEGQRGFIAQEVQKIIPEAVSQSRGFIPDIMAAAQEFQFDPVSQNLRVGMKSAHGLKPGDLVRLILDDSTTEHRFAAVPDENTIVVSGVPAGPARAFVYGKQVDDFLAVDYDRIFTTVFLEQ
jgi:hypothetical protein